MTRLLQTPDPNSKESFGDMCASIQRLRDKLAAQASRVIDLFKRWDNDSDGKISRAEFARAMPELGLAHSLPGEINGLFNTFDPDGSGEITFRELHRMLRKSDSTVQTRRGAAKQVSLVNIDDLRKDVKSDMLKMNFRVEFRHLAITHRPPAEGKSMAHDWVTQHEESDWSTHASPGHLRGLQRASNPSMTIWRPLTSPASGAHSNR